jgi:hypothetical protein
VETGKKKMDRAPAGAWFDDPNDPQNGTADEQRNEKFDACIVEAASRLQEYGYTLMQRTGRATQTPAWNHPTYVFELSRGNETKILRIGVHNDVHILQGARFQSPEANQYTATFAQFSTYLAELWHRGYPEDQFFFVDRVFQRHSEPLDTLYHLQHTSILNGQPPVIVQEFQPFQRAGIDAARIDRSTHWIFIKNSQTDQCHVITETGNVLDIDVIGPIFNITNTMPAWEITRLHDAAMGRPGTATVFNDEEQGSEPTGPADSLTRQLHTLIRVLDLLDQPHFRFK